MIRTMLGTYIGDSWLHPFEMEENDSYFQYWDQLSFLPNKKMDILAGDITDDSEYSTLVAKSLLECNGFDLADITAKYVLWEQYYTSCGTGSAIRGSMKRLHEAEYCALNSGDPQSLGCGAAMRAAPFGIFFQTVEEIKKVVPQDAAITHQRKECIEAALFVALANRHVRLYGKNNFSSLLGIFQSPIMKYTMEKAARGEMPTITCKKDRFMIQAIMASVYWNFVAGRDMKDSLIMTAAGGIDTDSVGSMIGGFYGSMNNVDMSLASGVKAASKAIALDQQLYEVGLSFL